MRAEVPWGQVRVPLPICSLQSPSSVPSMQQVLNKCLLGNEEMKGHTFQPGLLTGGLKEASVTDWRQRLQKALVILICQMSKLIIRAVQCLAQGDSAAEWQPRVDIFPSFYQNRISKGAVDRRYYWPSLQHCLLQEVFINPLGDHHSQFPLDSQLFLKNNLLFSPQPWIITAGFFVSLSSGLCTCQRQAWISASLESPGSGSHPNSTIY